MRKIIEFLSKRIDKVAHCLLCMDVVLSLSCFMHWAIAVAAAVVVGLLKELIDQITYQGWDNMDLLADCIGILAGLAVVLLGRLV